MGTRPLQEDIKPMPIAAMFLGLTLAFLVALGRGVVVCTEAGQ